MPNIKKLTVLFLICILLLSSCGKKEDSTDENIDGADNNVEQTTGTDSSSLDYISASQITVEYSSFDLKTESDITNFTEIALNESDTKVSGTGAVYENSIIKITQEGAYRFSGTLSEGQIIVEALDTEKVWLILNNANVSCSTDAPIKIITGDKVAILLSDGSQNTITDARTQREELSEDEDDTNTNAAIYSACGLNFKGTGSITIKGGYNHGVYTKKTLKIMGGDINIDSSNAGLKGKNAVIISDGTIKITAKGDGIKSSETNDGTKGYVYISGGNIAVNTSQDGISGSFYTAIYGGVIDISTTGEVTASGSNDMMGGRPGGMGGRQMPGNWDTGAAETEEASDSTSSKGIKAGMDMYFKGGDIIIYSTGHSIHSSGSLTIDGGTFTTTSSLGKGIATHGDLTINDGTIDILKSYEGLESKTHLIINGGTTNLVASDDGINAGGSTSSSTSVTFNGGYVYVDASGDGIDSNGNMIFNGGTVVVAGPTSGGDGAIDGSEGTISANGGTLIAYGSSQMAEYPDTSSKQNVISITFNSTISSGTLIHIQDSKGNAILTLAPEKNMQNMVFSSADIVEGETYTVFTGGTCTGTIADGIYSGGTYSGGTEYTTFTPSSIVTLVGNVQGGMGGMQQPGGGFGGNNPGMR